MSEITRYTIHSEVTLVEERFRPQYVSGFGADCIFQQENLGWYVYLKGSYEALHLGTEKPDLKIGDRVKISIEKVDHAKP